MPSKCRECSITVDLGTKDANKCAGDVTASKCDDHRFYWVTYIGKSGQNETAYIQDCCNCARNRGCFPPNYYKHACVHCQARAVQREQQQPWKCRECSITVDLGTKDVSKCAGDVTASKCDDHDFYRVTYIGKSGQNETAYIEDCCNCARNRGWFRTNYYKHACVHCQDRPVQREQQQVQLPVAPAPPALVLLLYACKQHSSISILTFVRNFVKAHLTITIGLLNKFCEGSLKGCVRFLLLADQ
jgi:ribosomal protein L37AE/L43A